MNWLRKRVRALGGFVEIGRWSGLEALAPKGGGLVLTVVAFGRSGVARDFGAADFWLEWDGSDATAEVIERIRRGLASARKPDDLARIRQAFQAIESIHGFSLEIGSIRFGDCWVRYGRTADGSVCDILWSSKDRSMAVVAGRVSRLPGPLTLLTPQGPATGFRIGFSRLESMRPDETEQAFLERCVAEVLAGVDAGYGSG